MLPMNLIISFGNRTRRKQAVLGYRFASGCVPPMDLRHVDATIYDHGSDMNPLRPELPCHALCDRTRAKLRCGESSELWTSTNGSSRTCEDHRTLVVRQHVADGLSAKDE